MMAAASDGSASTCCGVTSRIWARASRRRSAYDFGMGLGAPMDDGLAVGLRGQGGEAWDDRRGDDGSAAPAVRPAGDTCSGRGFESSGCPGSASAEVLEHVLQRIVAEHPALETSRTDLDAEQVEEVVRADTGDIGKWLALDLVGQKRRARLADRAATAG